jgi:hypothetical protein
VKSETRVKIGFWASVILLVLCAGQAMFVGNIVSGILLIILGLFVFGGFAFAVYRKWLKISLSLLFLVEYAYISEVLRSYKGDLGTVIISMGIALIVLLVLSQAVIGVYQQMKEKPSVNAISAIFGLMGGIFRMAETYEAKRELQYTPTSACKASLLSGFLTFCIVFLIIRCFIFGSADHGTEKAGDMKDSGPAEGQK